MIVHLCDIKISASLSFGFVTTHACVRQTDRRTDGHTDGQNYDSYIARRAAIKPFIIRSSIGSIVDCVMFHCLLIIAFIAAFDDILTWRGSDAGERDNSMQACALHKHQRHSVRKLHHHPRIRRGNAFGCVCLCYYVCLSCSGS